MPSISSPAARTRGSARRAANSPAAHALARAGLVARGVIYILIGWVAILVAASIGDYRAGDEIWCRTLGPGEYSQALNRDVLVPRPAGRFMFGRLINHDEERLQILPLEAGGLQQVVANPPWLGRAVKLVRAL